VAAMTPGLDAAGSPQRKRPVLPPTRSWRALCLAAALVVLPPAAASGAASASERAERRHPRVRTTVLEVPAGGPEMDPSEPHIAVDPNDPKRLFAVAQVGPESFRMEFLWRSNDGGKTWTRSPLLGGSDNSPAGEAHDPVAAAGGHGLVLYGTMVGDIDAAAGTGTLRVGTRVSTDGGASFTGFGSADQTTLPLCVFDGSCLPPPGARFLDKPWLAIDTTGGPFSGTAYLVWFQKHIFTGQRELLVAVSRDQGRTYGPPVLLAESNEAELAGLEENAQVAVRPNGTVDVVWNGLRDGRPLILHAWSTDGGASFSASETVVRLQPDASREGVVTSLAASPRGRLALCWQQARSPDPYDQRVACKVRARRGGWGPQQAILPGDRERQYLPVATFQGERLWVAAYVSNATSTRLMAIRRVGHHFGHPLTVNRWPIPSERICGPIPPACPEGGTFIGDYIGMVAAGRHLVVAYIQPSADPSEPNRVLVSSFGSG
jgi:hypothetical protein